MGLTIGFAFMMSRLDVGLGVGGGITTLTVILSRSEKEAREGMGRFLLALVCTMCIVLAGVVGGNILDSIDPLIGTIVRWCLAICWIVCLASDYRRWRRQDQPSVREVGLNDGRPGEIPK